MFARLIACGSLAAEVARFLAAADGSWSDAGAWLLSGALAALPFAYGLLGALHSWMYDDVTGRFDFDPIYVSTGSR